MEVLKLAPVPWGNLIQNMRDAQRRLRKNRPDLTHHSWRPLRTLCTPTNSKSPRFPQRNKGSKDLLLLPPGCLKQANLKIFAQFWNTVWLLRPVTSWSQTCRGFKMAPASLLRKGMAAGKAEIRCALVTTSSCRLTSPMVGCRKSAKRTPKTTPNSRGSLSWSFHIWVLAWFVFFDPATGTKTFPMCLDSWHLVLELKEVRSSAYSTWQALGIWTLSCWKAGYKTQANPRGLKGSPCGKPEIPVRFWGLAWPWKVTTLCWNLYWPY